MNTTIQPGMMHTRPVYLPLPVQSPVSSGAIPDAGTQISALPAAATAAGQPLQQLGMQLFTVLENLGLAIITALQQQIPALGSAQTGNASGSMQSIGSLQNAAPQITAETTGLPFLDSILSFVEKAGSYLEKGQQIWNSVQSAAPRILSAISSPIASITKLVGGLF